MTEPEIPEKSFPPLRFIIILQAKVLNLDSVLSC